MRPPPRGATELYKGATKDLRLTQELLGHKSPVTTALYTSIGREGALEAVERISAGTLPRHDLGPECANTHAG
jgi:site-specific recombinase XerD